MMHYERVIRPVLYLVLLLGAVFILVGCSTEGEPWQNVVWEWLRVVEISTEDSFEVDSPGNYSIVFRPDGSYSGMADCNVMGGTYEWDSGGKIMITPGPTTLAYCGEQSVDYEYVYMLSRVESWKLEDDWLILVTADGAEQMEFRNGGAAPEE